MHFGPVPLDQAEGRILGHNVSDEQGRRVLRKGTALSGEDVERLATLGRSRVYVATFEEGDVGEDEAALRVTRATIGEEWIRLSGPRTGRVNVHTTHRGIVRVDTDRLSELNEMDGITLATVYKNTAVREGRMIATTKILPYALPESTVCAAETLGLRAQENERPMLWLDPILERRVGLVVSAAPGGRDRVVAGFESALRARLEALGSTLEVVEFVAATEDEAESRLADALTALEDRGVELLLLAGETAIQDHADLAPRAVERAGGEITCYGAPVDPGNLLMVAYLHGIPVLGAPGCARSPKQNIVDLVLPRLLAGERLERRDIIELGHGGLLDDVPERPLPRSRL